MKRIICFLLGHKPVTGQEKDMFGFEYVWQKAHCSRCGKKLN
ncbi:MAG TPA: hypothetical protein VFD33_06215 [Bacillota bacterium]|nr:hypothetical protein [Bacillota bacterium]